MTLELLVQEMRSLPVEQRKQLVLAILDSLTEDQPVKTHRIQEFRGAAAHLRDMDAQAYVNQLRDEFPLS
ncbi:MAG: hypothetical protein K8L97_27170 [Anaerolineae bacterium]|nr:hypothetical protein [Anaerolineae bacterium]